MSDSQYFSSRPTSEEKVSSFVVALLGMELPFLSASGMFSVGSLDRGAKTLIEHSRIKETDSVLDLGCAYGVVGVFLARYYGCRVTLVDINQRAVKYARKNIEANNVVDVCIAKQSDGFAKIPEEMFDVILFNPPQHAGKKECLRLIDDAFMHLNPGGTLQVVARHNKGGASFEKYLAEQFGSVETLCRKGGFRIYCVEKK